VPVQDARTEDEKLRSGEAEKRRWEEKKRSHPKL
jgi:hypothetical protein